MEIAITWQLILMTILMIVVSIILIVGIFGQLRRYIRLIMSETKKQELKAK